MSRSHVSLNRLVASLLGIGLTTAVGSAGVAAAYYPLRHADYGLQWLAVFVLMTFESAAVHLPSEVILPAGGWLVVREHHLGLVGLLGLSVVAAAGNTLGSTLLYAAGSYGGRPLVRRFGPYFLVHEADLDRAEIAMQRHHVWALALTRVLPVVRTYGGFAAGVLRLPLTTFVPVTFIGSLAWCLPFVFAGEQLGEHWSRIKGPAEVVGLVVVALLVVGLVVFSLRQTRLARDS
jgi:membrane protein DedA with SNARE-associated domain